jgi:hypothetical protein
MADRHLIENREAAVGMQMFHMRQRWGAAVWRAQTQVLLGRLKYALPGWEEAPESRRAADTATEANCRSHASGSGDGGGAWRRYQLRCSTRCWARRRRGSRRQAAVERLGERRRLRAWPEPARGRPVFFGGRAALLGL